MKILQIGRFNVSNIGDLAISKIVNEKLSEYGTVTRINLTGAPYKFADVNNVNNVNARKYRLRNLITKYKLTWILKLRKKTSNESNFLNEFEKVISQNDIIVIAGGNMLMSVNNNVKVIDLFNNYVEIAKKFNKPILVMDIGIGPFHSKNHLNKAIESLNGCNFITFRDEKSYKMFVDAGGHKDIAFVSVDPVFYFGDKIESQIHNKPNKIIGFNVFNHGQISSDKKAYKKLLYDYTLIIDKLVKKNYKVVLFDTTLEDRQALLQLYSKYVDNDRVVLKKISGLEDLRELYSEVDLIIGTRMHSMIIAFSMGVPVIGFYWQEKIKQFFKIIESEELLYDIHQIDKNVNKIVNGIDDILGDYQHVLIHNSIILNNIKEKRNINDKILNKIKADL